QRQSDAAAVRQHARRPRRDCPRRRGLPASRPDEARRMSNEDLQALRNPLLLLVIVLIAGAAAVYYSGQFRDSARRQLTTQEAQLRDARLRLQRSGDEREIIVRHLDRYRTLQRAGFIGEEQRINWLDGLRVANQQ